MPARESQHHGIYTARLTQHMLQFTRHEDVDLAALRYTPHHLILRL